MSEESGEPPKGAKPKAGGAGGIASLAALAASKKKQQSTPDDEQTNPKSAGVSSIASLAALAASSKKKEIDFSEKATNVSGDGKSSGGIAAMAAAAAAAKKTAEGKSNEGNEGAEPTGTGNSIAGLAALSAQKKEAGKASSASSMSISSLAALAAQKKEGKQSESKDESSGNPIASLADLAAQKKRSGGEQDEDAPIPGGGGSIASLAALPAQRKKKGESEPIEANTAVSTEENDSIANLAAQAANIRQASGSIASLAALAGTEKAGTDTSIHDEASKQRVNGSMASLAALSAQKKQERPDVPTPEKETPPASPLRKAVSTPGGRLATMAMAVRSRKDKATEADKAAPSSRGVSAALSDTPRKRKIYDEQSGLYHHGESVGKSRLSDFAANTGGALFQLGSNDLDTREHGLLVGQGRGLPTRSKTATVPGFPRRQIRRNKSSDGSIFRVRRTKSGSMATSVEEWAGKSSSFPPNNPAEAGEQSTGMKRSASHGDAEVKHPDTTGDIPPFAESSPTTNIEASLGFGSKNEDEKESSSGRAVSSPSVLCQMRRSSMVKNEDYNKTTGPPERQSSESSRNTIN